MVPVSEPIEFQVMQNMQTALKAISKAGGYHHDVASFAVKLDPNHEVEEFIGEEPSLPFFVLEPQPDEFQYFPASQVRVRLPFIVHAIHESDTTDDDALQETYFRLCADVEKALAVDITRGGLASLTTILERQIETISGKQVWAMLTGEVAVHRTYGVPNA